MDLLLYVCPRRWTQNERICSQCDRVYGPRRCCYHHVCFLFIPYYTSINSQYWQERKSAQSMISHQNSSSHCCFTLIKISTTTSTRTTQRFSTKRCNKLLDNQPHGELIISKHDIHHQRTCGMARTLSRTEFGFWNSPESQKLWLGPVPSQKYCDLGLPILASNRSRSESSSQKQTREKWHCLSFTKVQRLFSFSIKLFRLPCLAACTKVQRLFSFSIRTSHKFIHLINCQSNLYYHVERKESTQADFHLRKCPRSCNESFEGWLALTIVLYVLLFRGLTTIGVRKPSN